MTDHQAQLNSGEGGGGQCTNSEADTENADDVKSDVETTEDHREKGGPIEKLERGAFQPHPFPHINFTNDTYPGPTNQTDCDERGKDALSNGRTSAKHNHLPHWHHHYHLWTSKKLPHKSTEAHAIARADAASWAQLTPLIAATLGPLAVLLGIPSLTQRWHGQVLDPPVLADGSSNFIELPDPVLNLALAGVVLFCEVLGNFLLVLRFSNFHSKLMTWGSYLFWVAKIVIGLINYIQFGVTHPETGDIIYLEGFWVSSY